jgi:hypothetical protein
MDVGTQLVATPEPATAIGDGDRVACPAVSNTVANVVTVGRSALRLNEGIVSGPPTERGRVTICGAMLELALATIGEVAPSTKYAKVCNVIGKSLHGQLPPCWEAVNAQKPRLAHRFLRVSGLAPRWQKGQTLVNGREVV